jgi:REP element-mobilizing transposase RayT
MPRQLRVEYPGALCRVMSRGDRREDIFLDDVDRQDFLRTLAEACQKTGWQVHAYCLMRNHYHLAVETPNANLVAGMAWLQSTCTIRLNHRHRLIGHVAASVGLPRTPRQDNEDPLHPTAATQFRPEKRQTRKKQPIQPIEPIQHLPSRPQLCETLVHECNTMRRIQDPASAGRGRAAAGLCR